MHTVAFAVPVHLLVFRVTADAGTVDTDETYSPGQQCFDEFRGQLGVVVEIGGFTVGVVFDPAGAKKDEGLSRDGV